MEIADLLTGPDAVLACVKASSKKALLIELAGKAAHLFKLDERLLLDRLIERERLGSTGIGGGIAIPHGRMSPLAKTMGVFARLGHPVEWHAYRMQHEVCMEEVAALNDWLLRVLGAG